MMHYSRTIKSKDSITFQEDLHNLQTWDTILQMSFNPDKCEVINVTNKRKIIDASYSIHGTILKVVDEAKYLGVTLQSKMSWNHT